MSKPDNRQQQENRQGFQQLDVVDYVPSSNGLDEGDKFTERSVTIGFEIAKGRAHFIQLNNDEYSLPESGMPYFGVNA